MPSIEQDTITAGELAAVCAQYDLGVVRQVRPLGRGSRRSAKAVLGTTTGWYLLKRRGAPGAPGGQAGSQADPRRVALSHDAQIYLRSAGFPVPELVGTRADRNSMLQVGERVYEVYRFVPGTAYDGSPGATAAAGRALGDYHRLMRSFTPRWDPPAAGYHALPGLGAALEGAARRAGLGPAERSAARRLARAAEGAAREVERLGAASIGRQVIHGDWHPGNLLFRGGEVAAVVDHDSVGVGARAMDFAYGLLHFSLSRGRPGEPTGERPLIAGGSENPDTARMATFASGYHQRSGTPLAGAEAAAAPWLMIEAAAADAAGALTGLRSGGSAVQGTERADGGDGGIGPAAGLLGAIAGLAERVAQDAERLARLAGGS